MPHAQFLSRNWSKKLKLTWQRVTRKSLHELHFYATTVIFDKKSIIMRIVTKYKNRDHVQRIQHETEENTNSTWLHSLHDLLITLWIIEGIPEKLWEISRSGYELWMYHSWVLYVHINVYVWWLQILFLPRMSLFEEIATVRDGQLCPFSLK